MREVRLGALMREGVEGRAGEPLELRVDLEAGLWVELLDEAGERPLAGTRWAVELPSGERRELVADARGRLRLPRPLPVGAAVLRPLGLEGARALRVPLQRDLGRPYRTRVLGARAEAAP